jgi:hypothetical protein
VQCLRPASSQRSRNQLLKPPFENGLPYSGASGLRLPALRRSRVEVAQRRAARAPCRPSPARS